MWWLVACVLPLEEDSTSKPDAPMGLGPGLTSTGPSTTISTPTGSTGDTSSPGTIDTGFTPTGAVSLTTSEPEWAPCAESTNDPYSGWLLVTPTAPGQVLVHHHGASDGCGCQPQGAGLADAWWFQADGNLMMKWYNGDCDGAYCCDFQVTVDGLPPGTWTVNEAWGTLSTEVTVE